VWWVLGGRRRTSEKKTQWISTRQKAAAKQTKNEQQNMKKMNLFICDEILIFRITVVR
jgi:heme/copper-type cytochrome/quinol oxidase subunit 3